MKKTAAVMFFAIFSLALSLTLSSAAYAAVTAKAIWKWPGAVPVIIIKDESRVVSAFHLPEDVTPGCVKMVNGKVQVTSFHYYNDVVLEKDVTDRVVRIYDLQGHEVSKKRVDDPNLRGEEIFRQYLGGLTFLAVIIFFLGMIGWASVDVFRWGYRHLAVKAKKDGRFTPAMIGVVTIGYSLVIIIFFKVTLSDVALIISLALFFWATVLKTKKITRTH
jgi:hypothetical protein